MATVTERLAALEEQLAVLRQAVRLSNAFADDVYHDGYHDGRASVLGASAVTRPPRPWHLAVVREGHQ